MRKAPTARALKLSGAALLLGVALPATASDWDYTASIYLWAAGIEGTTKDGSSVEIGFEDLLENLNFAFMGTFEARKNDWSLIGDAVHLDVGAGKNGSIPFPGPGPGTVDVAADVEVTGWVLNLLGGYTVARTEQSVIDLVGGARYLDVDTALDATATIGPLPPQTRNVRADYTSWDAVVGLRGRTDFGNKWFATYYADLGTGESNLTWQLAGGVGYQFGWGDVTLAYRHMEWDTDKSKAIDDIDFSGPLLAAGWHF
jgi:hypothetical protein